MQNFISTMGDDYARKLDSLLATFGRQTQLEAMNAMTHTPSKPILLGFHQRAWVMRGLTGVKRLEFYGGLPYFLLCSPRYTQRNAPREWIAPSACEAGPVPPRVASGTPSEYKGRGVTVDSQLLSFSPFTARQSTVEYHPEPSLAVLATRCILVTPHFNASQLDGHFFIGMCKKRIPSQRDIFPG
ncbi:hypothetical protein B0H13DRAFT_1854654 [Mycena leptocephala]|nr:hypothetical protein B0H13DRAFT_1854654 [Mycena leptocephala]